ncbi:MAG TPA: luciferase family protein [Thermoplasmata archaeon]|nr:luciferase family protein [Thermoplasmata archaeon]
MGTKAPARSTPTAKPASVRAELERRLVGLPGLDRRPSRWGERPAYFVGEREIAHFHGDLRMDVRLTKELIRERTKEHAFDERVRTRGPSAEWASVTVASVRDIPLALALVEDAIRANG